MLIKVLTQCYAQTALFAIENIIVTFDYGFISSTRFIISLNFYAGIATYTCDQDQLVELSLGIIQRSL